MKSNKFLANPGDYYDKDGKYIGKDERDDNKTYVTTQKKFDENINKKDEEGNAKPDYDGLRKTSVDLNIKHTDFQKEAATVYGESSAFKLSTKSAFDKLLGLRYEMFAIASVHKNNGNAAYGVSSAMAKSFLNTKPSNRKGLMTLANAAVINTLIGGFDYSNGANLWDGMEQASFSDEDKRFSTGRWELHKNTMGWKIEDSHFGSWKQFTLASGNKFIAPKISFTPDNLGKFNKYFQPNTIKLQSTAQYLGTIFWKELKGKAVIYKKLK